MRYAIWVGVLFSCISSVQEGLHVLTGTSAQHYQLLWCMQWVIPWHNLQTLLSTWKQEGLPAPQGFARMLISIGMGTSQAGMLATLYSRPGEPVFLPWNPGLIDIGHCFQSVALGICAQ